MYSVCMLVPGRECVYNDIKLVQNSTTQKSTLQILTVVVVTCIMLTSVSKNATCDVCSANHVKVGQHLITCRAWSTESSTI